ncbi:MAG TPA: cytochrome P450 [Acidimicrobiales bacterium]|nr:cytochrome P450 [Acidimicrobiales bacterium]
MTTTEPEIDLGDDHADITSHDTFVQGVPHATFLRLRREDPVAWFDEADGSGFWAVTKYRDIIDVSRDPDTFTSTKGIRLEEMDEEETAARRTIMETDPPEHTRLRRLVNRGFTRKAVLEYEESIRELAAAVCDDAVEAREFDFVDQVARQLPMRMLGRLLGIPDTDGAHLVELGDQMIANSDPEFTQHVVDQSDTEEYRLLPFRSPAAIELFDYAQEQADDRRAHPGDDIITKLLQPTTDGEPLSDLEFKNFFSLMVAAGNDTTRYTMTAGMKALLDRPHLLDELRHGDEKLWETATEEILRWGSVTMHFRRTATRDVELRERQIHAGDKVVTFFISGDYDEDQFADPFRFDIRRDPNDHMAFGRGGPHLCLGAWLARLEIRVLFQELVARVRSVEQTGPEARLRSNFIAGIKHLPVRITPV